MQVFAYRNTCPHCRGLYRRAITICPLDGARLRPLPADPLLGEVVAGFRVERALGDGGSGRHYVGRDRRGRTCLLRVLFGEQAASERHRQRLVREAEVVLGWEHPNIVRVLGAGQTEMGLPYLMTELVDGRSLRECIDRDAPLGAKRIASILEHVTAGLLYMHERHVVHCDLHPDNIILEYRDGKEIARIAGFGNAVRVGEQYGRRGATRSRSIPGSTAHASPERLERRFIDQRCDQFSLGVVLYEMLCGRLPFSGSSLVMATSIIYCDPPPIADRAPGLNVDWRLEALACRLMQRRPDQRFTQLGDMLDVVDALQW